MILSKKRKNGFLALGLAFGVFATSVVSPILVSVLASDYSVRNVLSDTYLQTRASAVEEDLTLSSVREEAKEIYTESKKALDLDLSTQNFNGSTSVNYAGKEEIQVLNNLAKGTDDQTVIVRFKTSTGGLIFGAGADTAATTGNNMTLAVIDGKLRVVLRNKKKDTNAPAGGLKGTFGSGLADGNWHTVAISFAPSEDYTVNNIRLVIDGGEDLYGSTGWGNSWKGGFNQGDGNDFSVFQVGGGDYTKLSDYATSAFNGAISSLTVINKAYTIGQLQDITSMTISKNGVREEARAAYASENKTGFDLDLSDQTFDGTKGIDYSSDTDYMSVLKNLKTTTNDQTIVLRFKTTTGGLLFGAGADTEAPNGKNMSIAIRSDGKLRIVFRNTKKDGEVPASGLKGIFSSGLTDGNWHTVAISLLPSKGYDNDNVRIAVDGTDLAYASNSWGSAWKAGFNQGAGAEYTQLQIGGGSYVGVSGGDYASSSFSGKIDFVTVLDKAYEIEDLKSITYEKKSLVDTKLTAMSQSGTGKTWLFTGGTEAVADFKNSGTVRNWVALFEDTMRNNGSYIERGRFVFNTAKRDSDISKILAAYDTQIAAYHTEAVAIEVGAADYQKGQDGLDTFKNDLKTLIDKMNADGKLAVVITPYASKDSSQNENVTLYRNAIEEVASEDAKIVDFSSIAADKINSDGTLTPDGHQAAANIAKNTLGFGSTATSYNFNLKNLAAGSYTVQKKESASNVTASVNNSILEVHVPGTAGTAANLTYTLEASDGQTLNGKASTSDFCVSDLKVDETYTLTVNDISRTDKVTESYKPVSIKISNGAVSTVVTEESTTNYDFSDLLTSDKAQTYLFMGDSITHGVVTRGYDNVPQLFAKYLDEIGRKDDVVINTGVSNATIATTLNQIETRLTRYKPDVAVIMLGTNDCALNGENTVNATGSTTNGAITVDEYKNRYKTLIRKIHDNNANTRIVLRVPCEMIKYGQRQNTYHSFFAAIPEVAAEIKTEIPDLKIAVVDHLADWNYYHDNVRNDNLANIKFSDTETLSCGWFADGLHPNGRGNVEMFQQIIKELNMYKADSELANFSYVLSDWTDTSSIKATATQKYDRVSLPVSQLSSYTNGLRDVTLTLIDPDGTEISRTAAYDANGTISLNTLDTEKTYTIRVTGTDKTNSKQVTFSSGLKKDTTVTTEEKNVYDQKLEAINTVLGEEQPEKAESSYTAETWAAYKAAQKTLSELINAEKENPNYNENKLQQCLQNYRSALRALKETATPDPTPVETDKKDPVTPDTPAPNPGTTTPAETVKKGEVVTIGKYRYQVTDTTKKTVAFVGVADKSLKKVTIAGSVKIGNEMYRVTSIKANALKGNKKISSVIIGKNVTTIGARAFSGCKNLKKITVKTKSLKKVGRQALKGIHKKAVIKVPKKKKAVYRKVFSKKGQAKSVAVK